MADDSKRNEDDRSMTEDQLSGHSLPPMNGATGAEVLHAALPLIVRAASESASAATRSATTQANVEAQLREFKASVDANTAIMIRWVDAKEKEIQICEAEIEARNEGNKRWHETLRSIVTPQVLLQIIVQVFTLVGIAFGLYQVMPAPASPSATLPGTEVPAVQPPSHP